ncbi:amidohydrolase [Lewinella sp. JB7]|uniref:amidohydrolase n=1 Tax=Lewinella sp. JB7 TaxID=2962887 RepID=UPI0020C9EEF4|nr:amidohydrolase [Lewinella sp. JB7]MCP9234306.1 amidohydrolase [Lewinella sp. JB7]
MIDRLERLRKTLHRFPDLSGAEGGTAERIRHFIREHAAAEIIGDMGDQSFAAVYAFPGPGPTVMIRCELDALPITETGELAHRSTVAGVSHKCGHDGHMAIACGVLQWLTERSFAGGRVAVLFQSAEETGRGARQVVGSEAFRSIAPDYVFALHNIPGEPLHEIITVEGTFSSEVRSFAVVLTGVECHAAEPENGINPTAAVGVLIGALAELQLAEPYDPNYALLTPVHVSVGQKSYGISPGSGELHYTVRARTGQKMQALVTAVTDLIGRTAAAHGLTCRLDWFEHFPATRNNAEANTLIRNATQRRGLTLNERPHPFAFGEDFGWFSGHAKVAMFGLGAGEEMPALHHPDYDFPDDLIATGVSVFSTIIGQLLPGVEQ